MGLVKGSSLHPCLLPPCASEHLLTALSWFSPLLPCPGQLVLGWGWPSPNVTPLDPACETVKGLEGGEPLPPHLEL